LYFFIGIPASLQSEFSLTPAATKNPGQVIPSEYANSLKENLSVRLEEAEKAGIGFALSAPSYSKISGAQAVAVEA